MASIGGIAVDVFMGEILPAVKPVKVWAQPYKDGIGSNYGAERNAPANLITYTGYASLVAADAAVSAAIALQDSLVAVTDARGRSFSNIEVLQVEPGLTDPAGGGPSFTLPAAAVVGFSGLHIVGLRWMVVQKVIVV